jgi:hypothetical protein
MNNKPRTIDERIDALTTHLELLSHDVSDLTKNVNRMAVGLNRLRQYALRIALDHEVRINVLEKLEQEIDDDAPEGPTA